MKFLIYFLSILLILLAQKMEAQLTGTYTVPGSYASIAAAITDLNTQGVSGTVTVLINAGYAETAPVGGYSLTATGTATSPIIFQKNGAGANPLLTAYVGGTANALSSTQDGIWAFIGCDYVTIDGISLIDLNVSNPSTMEYGFCFFKAGTTNGCNYNTIKNCVITLNRINTTYTGSRAIELVNSVSFDHYTPLNITSVAGANSNNSFYRNTIQNCNNGILFTGFADTSPFSFADQNNDIGGLSAVTGNTIINYGGDPVNMAVAGVKTVHQYNLNVSFNQIDNNNGAGFNHSFDLRGIYTTSATSANLSVTNNTISLKGVGAVWERFGIDNTSGSTPASNTVNISSNVIRNCVTTRDFYGIYNRQASPANLIMSNNTFTNNSSSGVSGSYYNIYNTGASPDITINNNSTGNLTVTTNFYNIDNSMSAPGGTVIINSNSIQAITYSGGSSGLFGFIFNGFGGLGSSMVTISNNVATNLSLATSGNASFISNNTSAGNILVSGNSINGSFAKTVQGGAVGGYGSGGTPVAGTETIIGNNFSNISVVGATSFSGISFGKANTSQNLVATSNTISNVTGGSMWLVGMSFFGVNTSTIQNNRISGFSSTGQQHGIETSGNAQNHNISNNSIGSFTTSHNLISYGYIQTSNGNHNFFGNKIYDLTANNSAGRINAIYVGNGNTINIYNNLIGDIKAPITNSVGAIHGIYIAGGSTVNIFYNTIRLAAVSSGINFGTNAIYSSTTPTVNLRNNILINLSSSAGTGVSTAYKRSAVGLSTFSTSSNNNLFYVGNPSPTKLIFSDGTNNMQTLASYTSFVAPREAASLTENTPFLSLNGTSANFLHVNNILGSIAESGAVNISGITDDVDANIRQGNIGYVGTGTAPDIGADEFATSPCNAVFGSTISPVSYTLCPNQTASFTATGYMITPGIQNQWQVSNTPGGPYVNVMGGNSAGYTTPTLAPGTYYYVEATTCTISLQTTVSNEATVTVYGTPSISFSPASPSICAGSSSVLITAFGANNYTWSPPTGLSGTSGPTVYALPPSTTTYVVTGTNLGGCTGTANVIVTVIPAAGGLTVTASPTNICQGGGANLLATATSSVYTVTPITFSPIPTPTVGVGTFCSNGIAVTPQNSGDLNDGDWAIYGIPFNFNFFSTSYNSYAVSTNGFMTLWPASNTANGYGQPFPSFTAGRPGIGAVYSNLTFVSTGTINSFVVGTTPNRRFVMNWLNGRFAPAGNGLVTTQLILYETTNVIEVHTTSNTGQLTAVEGIQNANATAAFVVPGRNSQTYIITNDAYRWSPTITYTWSPALYLGNPNIPNPLASNVQSNIVYTVLTQAANGCINSGTVSINVNPSPTLSILSSTTAICQGNTVSLVASGANTYTWNVGGNSPTITPGPAVTTTYIVTGTGTLNACTGSATQVITVTPIPTVSIVGSSMICIGQNASLTASGANSYSWSNGGITPSISPSPTATTIYSVIGTNTLGACTGTAMQTVTVNPNPTLTIVGSSLICSGQTATLNGSGANTYSWSNGGITATIFPTPSVTTVYSVVGTSSLGSCTGTAMQTVSVNPSPTLTALGNTIICAGQSTSLSVSGANTYSWSNGPITPSISVTPSITSNFSVVGTSTTNACTSTAVLIVTVVPIPTVSISGPTAICVGQTATLTGNGAGTYSWSNGSTLIAINVSPSVNANYSVVGISGPGCSGSVAITLTVNPLPTLTISVIPSATICAGESAQLIATVNGANTFSWSNGANTNSTSVSPTVSTVYTLQVSNSTTSCSATQSFSLMVDPCLGFASVIMDGVLKVYPNPFNGTFNIEVKKLADIKFEITDLSGRIIREGKLSSIKNVIEMSSFAKGIYYLKLSGDYFAVYKIISE